MIINIRILLLAMIFNLVQPEFWRIITFESPIIKKVTAVSKVYSVFGCLVYCSTSFSSVMVSVQDGFCYCLTSHPSVNLTSENILLKSMMTKLSDKSDCSSKEYDIYPELRVCMKFQNSRKTWQNAVRHCNQDGGYLLNVDSEAKFNASIDFVKSFSRDQIYVGGLATFWNDSNTEYHWTRGSLVDRFWAINEPTFVGSIELCTSIMGNERLNNYVCVATRPFLCELLLF